LGKSFAKQGKMSPSTAGIPYWQKGSRDFVRPQRWREKDVHLWIHTCRLAHTQFVVVVVVVTTTLIA
jgi:hypothetical protein